MIRRNHKQSGFTLMELLIVIAVLGLLLGMLIPRLGGVTDDTVDTVCDTNNKGIRYYTQNYYNKHNALPDGLTNLVAYGAYASTAAPEAYEFTRGTTAALPTHEDADFDDAEVLAEEFVVRNWPGLYELNAGEVAELKAMGIQHVYDLEGENRSMEKVTLSEGHSVLMHGIKGSAAAPAYVAEADFAGDGTTTLDDGDGTTTETLADGAATGNPEWLGRIMLAVNDRCDLVSKGMIQASALCPGAVLNEDNFTHKEYILILPRLEATVDALTALADQEIYYHAAENGVFIEGRQLSFTFAAQEPWQFDLTCPEGHKWPDNEEDHWIYIGTTGTDTTPTTASLPAL